MVTLDDLKKVKAEKETAYNRFLEKKVELLHMQADWWNEQFQELRQKFSDDAHTFKINSFSTRLFVRDIEMVVNFTATSLVLNCRNSLTGKLYTNVSPWNLSSISEKVDEKLEEMNAEVFKI